MRGKRVHGGLWPLVALALMACSDRQAAAPAAPPSGASLTTIELVSAQAAQQWRFDGIVEAERQTVIAAQTAGRVVALPFDVGDRVRQGEVLVRLTATEQHALASAAAASLAEATARARESTQQFERINDLFERRLVARSQYDAARANADAARARVEAARGQLTQAREQSAYTVVRAPYDGIIMQREARIGEAVSAGRRLITMLAPDALRVAADIPQQAIAALRDASEVHVIRPDGSALPAGAVRIAPGADETTRSYHVLAALPDRTLSPGTLVKFAFASGERTQIAVPSSALVHRSELDAVYVVDAAQHVSLRYVRIGEPGTDGDVPVHAGLSAGERVATDPVAAAAACRQQLAPEHDS